MNEAVLNKPELGPQKLGALDYQSALRVGRLIRSPRHAD